MRILGYIHTFNDEEVIEQSLQALRDQTYLLNEILLVDNGSTDGTLQRSFPKQVTIVRHPENRGTSGAVVTGFRYAVEKHYDWIWVLDADSKPCADALQKLVDLYLGLPPILQEQVWLLSSLPMEYPKWALTSSASVRWAFFSGNEGPQPRHGVIFTRHGYERVQPNPNQTAYEFHGSIWCGCLFKLKAIQKVGFPEEDYFLDFGEYAYCYRGMRSGYKAFMHQSSLIHHNVTGLASLSFTPYRLGPISFKMIELAPVRCYYVVRNTLYFWLHEYHVRNFHTLIPRFFKIGMLTLNFLLRPLSHWSELSACLRGAWDGLLKNMHKRYS